MAINGITPEYFLNNKFTTYKSNTAFLSEKGQTFPLIKDYKRFQFQVEQLYVKCLQSSISLRFEPKEVFISSFETVLGN